MRSVKAERSQMRCLVWLKGSLGFTTWGSTHWFWMLAFVIGGSLKGIHTTCYEHEWSWKPPSPGNPRSRPPRSHSDGDQRPPEESDAAFRLRVISWTPIPLYLQRL